MGLKMGEKGRPAINENYVFNDYKYLKIIFLIYRCEVYKRYPLFIHLKYALVEKYYINEYKTKVINKFFTTPKSSVPDDYKSLRYFSYIFGKDGLKHDLPIFKTEHVRNVKVDKIVIDNQEVKVENIIKSVEFEPDESVKTDIILQSLEFITMIKMFDLNNKLMEGEIKSLEGFLAKSSELVKEKLIKKPFKKEDDLRKYMNYLNKLELIETNGMKRNAHYKLTEKCRRIIMDVYYNNLKYELKSRISLAPGGLIEHNFNKIIDLLDATSITQK